MNLNQFLAELAQQGVKLWAEDGQLRYRAPKGVLTPELRDELALHKAELVLLLHQSNANRRDADLPLVRVERDRDLPLSFAQARMWFLSELEPNNPFYNELQALRLHGSLNLVALEKSLNKIIARHSALRTNFLKVDGQPVQVIAESLTLSVPVVDLRDLPESEREISAQRLAIAEAQQPFDLASSPLIRTCVLKLTEVEHILLLTIHHIVWDDWSWGILLRELATLYSAFCNDLSPELPELSIQYKDFAVWQRQWLLGEVLESQLAYWKQQLEGAPALLELATDRVRPSTQTYRGAHQGFALSKELTLALVSLSQRPGVTLFMTLLAAFQTFLYHYTGQTDICVGTSHANRDRPETESIIGFFVNLLVLRTDLSGNPSFRELLGRVRQVALEAYAHQNLPFVKLVEALRPERKTSHTPLVQVLFVLNIPMPALELPGLTLTLLKINNKTAKFDLTLFLEETEQGLVGVWNYSTDLFDALTITRMSGHFQTLLESIVSQPDARLSNLEMLTEAEKRQQAKSKQERQENKLKKFMKVEPKTVSSSHERLVKTEYLPSGKTLPLVFKPTFPDIDIINCARNNREFIETKLLHHGAILLRGFNLDSVSAFENLAGAICQELFGEYGDLPRSAIGGKVYGSTPYPADKAILFHNESSHMHCWPLKIWFFCVQPALQGGETPIVDCRKVYQLLDPKLRSRFEQKQLMYVRNYTPGLDVSWQEFFHTKDKAVVESYCRLAATEFEWKQGDALRTRRVARVIAKHPLTGESVFFNQILLHHVSCLEPAVRESLLSLFGEDNLPRNIYYGDGSQIENEVIQEILAVYQEATISFPWQQGDVLMLDNMLTAHGRNPYVGPRKIVVAMGEIIRSEDIDRKGMEAANAQ